MREFNIDPSFSVYNLVKRTQHDTSILSHRLTMSIISNEIENATLRDNAETIIFSSFQRMSRFLPQVSRYRQIAEKAQRVFVFGEMDITPPPIAGITYVPLSATDQLAKEWFLVSYGRDFFSALATEELSHIDDPDHQRKFRGIWTFDLSIISILNQWLSNVVGLRIEERVQEQHNMDTQVRLMSNLIGRINVRNMDVAGGNKDIIHEELNEIVREGVYPSLQKLRDDPPREWGREPVYRVVATAG